MPCQTIHIDTGFDFTRKSEEQRDARASLVDGTFLAFHAVVEGRHG